jgi:hypothetical protein
MPSTCTVQAPHSAAPQPNFVPVMPSTSRKDRRSHGSDAAVAPDHHFYAAVRWAAFDALSRPPSAHLEKKI